MDCALAMLAAAALGVTFGWEPVDDGSDGVEYVVQLEPELVDVLQSGQLVPIESYVPAEAGPVRKVRIVVGRDELARAVDSNRTSVEPIVRGQNMDEPVNYSAQFANDGWSDDRYRYDTSPAWPTNTSSSTSTAPDWSANSSTTTASSANSNSPLWPRTPLDSVRVANASSPQAAPSWTSAGIDASPPPPMTPTRTTAPSAPPRISPFDPPTKNNRYLATPLEDRNSTSPPASDWQRVAMATTTTTTSTERSVLALPDPPQTDRLQLPSPPPLSAPTNSRTAAGGSNWDTGWGTTAGAASATTESDLVPVVPLSSRRQDQPPTTAPQANSWADDDRWSWPTDGQPAASGQTVASQPASDWPAQSGSNSPTVPLRSDWATSTTASADNGWGDSPGRYDQPAATNPAPTNWPADFNNAPPVQTAATQPASPATQSSAPNLQPQNASPQPTSGPQEPWLPLLLVSLGLAGSIGANLFLGWSYMDARQRYRSLVRKTTDAFHRATGAAA